MPGQSSCNSPSIPRPENFQRLPTHVKLGRWFFVSRTRERQTYLRTVYLILIMKKSVCQWVHETHLVSEILLRTHPDAINLSLLSFRCDCCSYKSIVFNEGVCLNRRKIEKSGHYNSIGFRKKLRISHVV